MSDDKVNPFMIASIVLFFVVVALSIALGIVNKNLKNKVCPAEITCPEQTEANAITCKKFTVAATKACPIAAGATEATCNSLSPGYYSFEQVDKLSASDLALKGYTTEWCDGKYAPITSASCTYETTRLNKYVDAIKTIFERNTYIKKIVSSGSGSTTTTTTTYYRFSKSKDVTTAAKAKVATEAAASVAASNVATAALSTATAAATTPTLKNAATRLADDTSNAATYNNISSTILDTIYTLQIDNDIGRVKGAAIASTPAVAANRLPTGEYAAVIRSAFVDLSVWTSLGTGSEYLTLDATNLSNKFKQLIRSDANSPINRACAA